MRLEDKGFVLTFGTSDAPAPKEVVPAGKPVPVMVHVESAAGNETPPEGSLRLAYRVNNGPPRAVPAERMWKSPRGKGA